MAALPFVGWRVLREIETLPAAVECPVRVIKVLRVAAEGHDLTWARLRLDAATLGILETVIQRELEHHLDRRLRSWEVLRALAS